MSLEIINLHAEVTDDKGNSKEVLSGVNLFLEDGKTYALMGPNGSGKTSLSSVIMGSPNYKITCGKILFNGEDITALSADERARKGIFMSFQHPKEISGINLISFLRAAYNSMNPESKKSLLEFYDFVKEKAGLLKLDGKFFDRYLNQGFSGGEKKKSEILQMLVLNPKAAILDETDSGLDIDALRDVAKGINNFSGKDKTILVITHYKRILEYIKPDRIFVMIDGRIVREEDSGFIEHLEQKGYDWLKNNNGAGI
ncbi:MAG: Fe-S cluster assembly ATPase SufC [Nanoarchaeota archaeon]|nr:Fe-S cluster assembly ATPase SufC [Nanoarchaeota archaeon]